MPLDVSKRWFAWAMWHVAQHYDALLAERKASLLGSIHGTVVEIGPGTGTNFRYYAHDIRWIGVEPNRHMHPYLRSVAESAGLEIDVRPSRAEALDLSDESADAVIATAVLCSVDDQVKALREIRRVLKPGGHFVFLEHVAAERGTALRSIQHIIQPLWSCLADGCHPVRDTREAIVRAGFEPITCESFRLPLGPIAPHIAGIAVRSSTSSLS
jgi:ubiquinone/menaquinone biosynthesis C-methylase UbiE